MSLGRFILKASHQLQSKGWGSEVKFFGSGCDALALFAHRVLFTIDCQNGTYRKCWELDEGVRIDNLVTRDKEAFLRAENGTIFRVDRENEGLEAVLESTGRDINSALQASETLLAYTEKGCLTLYSPGERNIVAKVPVTTDSSSKMLFHPSGDFIVYMNSKSVTAYRIRPFEVMWELKPSEWFLQEDFWEFSKDSRYFIICPYEASTRVCDAYTGKALAVFRKGNDEIVTEAHLSQDNKLLIASSCDHSVRVWDFEKSQRLSRGQTYHAPKFSYGLDKDVLRIALSDHKEKCVDAVMPSDDFKRAISYTEGDSTFYCWDIETGGLLGKHSFEFPIDDYRVEWHHQTAELHVVENTDGPNFENNLRPAPPFIRFSHWTVD